MAKKKGKGKKGKGKKGKGKKGVAFNTSKLLGMGVGAFADKKFIDGFITDTLKITDPKLKAVGKIILGEYAPKQAFVKNFLNDEEALRGGGDALIVHGMDELMTSMNIAGMGASDDDELVVAIEGTDDLDSSDDMDEDVLGDDDIDTVNEDVLGDDDIDTVNDDEEDGEY